MKIDYGEKFVLRNLNTNEVDYFILQPYTEECVPTFTGNIRYPIGYTTNPRSYGGGELEDGTNIITNISPIGKEALGKCRGDTFLVDAPNKQEKYFVVVLV